MSDCRSAQPRNQAFENELTYHHDDLVEEHVSQCFSHERRIRVSQLRNAADVIHTVNVLRYPCSCNVPIIILESGKICQGDRHVPVFYLGRIG